MSTNVFDDLTPWYPLTESLAYDVLISRSVSGHEQRRLLSLYGTRRFDVTFGIQSKTDCQVLWDFYEARYGRYDSWYFPNNNERVLNEIIGDKSSTDTYVAIHPPIGNIVVEDNAGRLVEDVDFSVVRYTGTLTFLRDVDDCFIHYDPCVKVRFDCDLERSEIMNAKFSINCQLIEVR